MSMQKKQSISKKASEPKARQAGVKVKTSMKAGYYEGNIGTRTGPMPQPHHHH